MAQTNYRTAFGSYTQVERIGGGGSGEVFRVTDGKGRAYGLKLLRNAVVYHKKGHQVLSEEKWKRFKQEVFFCMCAPHKNVVRVLDYGFIEENDLAIPFCVMPYYPQTLRTLMQTGISVDKILFYFAQILNGVEAAHLKDVCHRDLKPENILHNPDQDLLVVADFGIAHFQEEDLVTSFETKAGDRLANYQYAAPEQKEKSATVDHRCDIFALGLILNEMFTKRVIQGSNPILIGQVAPQYDFLDQIVEKMINQEVENRRENIDLVKLDLMEHKQGIFQRQRIDDITKDVVAIERPEDPYVLTLNRILAAKTSDSSGVSVNQLPVASVYHHCVKLIQDHNKIELTKIKDQAINAVRLVVTDWRKRYEKSGLPRESQKRYEAIDEVVNVLGPLFVVPLATLESRDEQFFEHKDVIADLLSVPGWHYYEGIDEIYEFPKSLGFVFQSLYGAKSVATSQLIPVFDLLQNMRVKLTGEREPQNIWSRNNVMYYPVTIGRGFKQTWDYVWDASKRMEWLQSLFGSTDQYQEALLAYSIALNIFELADLIANGQVDRILNPNDTTLPRIPPYFRFASRQSGDRAVTLLTKNRKVLETCWSHLNVSPDQMKEYWNNWMNKTRDWKSTGFGFSDSLPHETILP